MRVALVRLSRVIDRPASTTFLNEVPRALRRTNSLLVPVSISSRLPAVLRWAAVLRLPALRLAAAFFSLPWESPSRSLPTTDGRHGRLLEAVA